MEAAVGAGRTAAAPHLLNLVPDERFEDLAGILLDPATNGDVKAFLRRHPQPG
jgi:hypothetical protein